MKFLENTAKAVRYNERTAAERVNSKLKDNYDLEEIRVNELKKVTPHKMFTALIFASKRITNFVNELYHIPRT